MSRHQLPLRLPSTLPTTTHGPTHSPLTFALAALAALAAFANQQPKPASTALHLTTTALLFTMDKYPDHSEPPKVNKTSRPKPASPCSSSTCEPRVGHALHQSCCRTNKSKARYLHTVMCTPWRGEAHLAMSLRTNGDTCGRRIRGVHDGQWLLCLHRRRGLVSSAAARRGALHVAAV